MDALLGKIGVGPVKSYVFAGLLPAAVVVVGLSLYWGGPTAAEDILTKSVGTPKSVVPLLAIWLVLGLLLLVVRLPVLAFFEAMPSNWYERWLLDRKLVQRELALREMQELEWQYSAARWPERDFATDIGAWCPDWLSRPLLHDAVLTSHKARLSFEGMLARHRLGKFGRRTARRAIVHALAEFRLVTAKTPPQELDIVDVEMRLEGSSQVLQPADIVGAELKQWRAQLSVPGARSLFSLLAADTERDWIVASTRASKFPSGIWVHPTDLGNRLAALDDYAMERYGIDTTTLFTRLWSALPEIARGEVSDAKLGVEAFVALAMSFSTLSVASLFGKLSGNAISDAGLRTAWLIICLGLAYLSYRGAVASVAALATKTRALIDMHRLRVLAAFGYEPKTIGDELALFGELQQFLAQAAERAPTRPIKVTLDWSADAKPSEK